MGNFSNATELSIVTPKDLDVEEALLDATWAVSFDRSASHLREINELWIRGDAAWEWRRAAGRGPSAASPGVEELANVWRVIPLEDADLKIEIRSTAGANVTVVALGV